MIRLLLAIFLPPLMFLTLGRIFAAIICLILQITVIGWLPAALWAIYALNNHNTDKKIDRMKKEMQGEAQPQGEIAEAKAAMKCGARQIKRMFGMGSKS